MTETCIHCEEPVLKSEELTERTRFYDLEGRLRQSHRECALRAVLGGIGHHLDHEYWCLEMHDPDGGLSYRESARAVDRMVGCWAIEEDVAGEE